MKKINEVFETKDYNMFSFISNNRIVSKGHINKIMQSMKKRRLISPILVNEKGQIIDGQHRFLAQKELGLPIPYIEQEGYGEKETQILNTNTKNWSLLDWETYYCNKNNKNYLTYRDFRKEYRLPSEANMLLLEGKYESMRSATSFREGKFQILDLQGAINLVNKLISIGEYFKDYKDRMFIRAMITCFGNEDYDHNKFLKKLSYQGNTLIKCVDKKSYLRLIEDIYNLRSRENTKKLRLF